MRTSLALVLCAILVPALAFADDHADQLKLVERMSKQLRSRDVSERVDAAEILGKVGIPEAVAPLTTALKDEEPRVRRAAASALWHAKDVAKPAIPALREALNDPEPSVVVRAAGALISMEVPEKELAGPLRVVLERGDPSDRFLAARALIGIDPAGKLAQPMMEYLRKEAPDPKRKGSGSARRDNFEMGQKALRELAKEKDRSMIAPLMAELPQSPQIAQPILEALGEFQPPPDHWIDTLLGELNASDSKVRDIAVVLLGKQKAKAAEVKMWAMPVSRLCGDPDASVRNAAVRALQGAGGLALDGLSGVLQQVTADSDADIRARAAEAVGDMADAQFPIDSQLKIAAARKALPVLITAADKDPSHEVRRDAVKALNQLQLDRETIVPLLARIAVEQKDTQDVRWSALLSLRNRGKDAAAATETIRPLATDANADVRKDAQAALDAFKSEYSGEEHVTQTAAGDPAVREKALAYLRENKVGFTESDFYRALSDVDVEKVTAFLDGGMSPNLRFANAFGDPVLRVAVEGPDACQPAVRPTSAGTKAIVKLLLARGADPKGADDRGNTPLMEAAQKCDAEVVKMLLKAGADMNAKNKQGLTAFEFGLWNASDGAGALVAAGYRLPAEKAKTYREAYKNNPKSVALIDKATKSAGK
jgi:HEAT repeat protein